MVSQKSIFSIELFKKFSGSQEICLELNAIYVLTMIHAALRIGGGEELMRLANQQKS
ncbi:hypothetical protein [Bartonella sp. B1098]|uniref:hypothetical protein n=1 Tax=Bartonella sp. B1098 TaxID=2911421 RepID=UPI0020C4F170|nr:hypothetical protein [Bartonella sp. B1098]